MEAQSDIYAKFGEYSADPNEPEFDGDSTDAAHYNWSELRSCTFGLERENPGTPGDDANTAEKKAGKKKVDKVTFTKKVDWASPNLFLKCCVAKMKVEEIDPSWELTPEIETVRVEICRTANNQKFPFVIVVYSGVKIISYTVSMEGAEARETLELEVTDFKYGYRRTNPFTGEPEQPFDPDNPDSGVQWQSSESPEEGTADEDKDTQEDEDAAPAQVGAAAAAAAAGIVPNGSGGNGSTGLLKSANDNSLRANFPGLRDDNGFGLLPD